MNITYHANGVEYATAEEAKKALEALPSPVQAVYSQVMQAIYDIQRGNDAERKR